MTFAQDYFDRPWLWAANQAGHFVLGFIMTSVVLWLVVIVTGEYTNQIAAGCMAVLFYLAVIEIACQGWRGLDTCLDTYFVFLGAVPPYRFMMMDQVIHHLILSELIFVMSLAAGFLILKWRKENV